MGDIINLRQARKAKARTQAKAQADANRARHGLTKAERHQADADRRRQEALLDGARRDDKDDQGSA